MYNECNSEVIQALTLALASPSTFAASLGCKDETGYILRLYAEVQSDLDLRASRFNESEWLCMLLLLANAFWLFELDEADRKEMWPMCFSVFNCLVEAGAPYIEGAPQDLLACVEEFLVYGKGELVDTRRIRKLGLEELDVRGRLRYLHLANMRSIMDQIQSCAGVRDLMRLCYVSIVCQAAYNGLK